MNTRLIDYLQAKMAEREWNQSDLARHAKLNRGTVSNILNGNRDAGVDVLVSLARALNVPPDDLFREAGVFPSEPELTKDEKRFISLLGSLPVEKRKQLLDYGEFLVDKDAQATRGRKAGT